MTNNIYISKPAHSCICTRERIKRRKKERKKGKRQKKTEKDRKRQIIKIDSRKGRERKSERE